MYIYIYIYKKAFFNYKIKIEIKTTSALKNELKYCSVSEGNTCIAESKLEVLPLIWFSKGLVQF